jgi:ATP-binding cassette subfamily B multidrug efflux pump
VTADVEAVRMAVGPGLMYLANTAVAAPVALGFMFSTSPLLASVVLVPLVLLAVATKFLSPRLHAASLAMQEAQAELANRAQESFAGARVVKSYGREGGEEAAFAEAGEAYRRAVMAHVRVRCLFHPVFWMCEGIGLLLILWIGGGMVARGEMTLGDFTAFLGYNLLLTWPMIALGWVVSLLQRGAAAMDRIHEVLDAVPAVADPAEPVPLPPEGRGEVEIRDLSFSYGSGPPVLRDISLRVPGGNCLGIVGPTGSGKSTLLSLLARLFAAPAGAVRLDGVPVERLRVRDLRRALAFVPQETFLFSLSLRDNIGYGFDDGTPPGTAERAAEAARLAPEVERLPAGYDTLLGERGVNLSGGQKQRAAIARALALDPRVLVLDDCLSAVDADTEEAILRNLRDATRGRTTLLVSHRVAAVAHADEIVFLEAGRIVERGTHAELLARGGRYATLARLQRIESELEAGAPAAGTASP